MDHRSSFLWETTIDVTIKRSITFHRYRKNKNDNSSLRRHNKLQFSLFDHYNDRTRKIEFGPNVFSFINETVYNTYIRNENDDWTQSHLHAHAHIYLHEWRTRNVYFFSNISIIFKHKKIAKENNLCLNPFNYCEFLLWIKIHNKKAQSKTFNGKIALSR